MQPIKNILASAWKDQLEANKYVWNTWIISQPKEDEESELFPQEALHKLTDVA